MFTKTYNINSLLFAIDWDTRSIEWDLISKVSLLSPELVLCGLIILNLLWSPLSHNDWGNRLFVLALQLVSLLVPLGWLIVHYTTKISTVLFGRYYIIDYYTTTSKAAVVFMFIVFIIMLTNFEYRILLATVKDFILIILLSLLFCFLIISTFDLFMLYLCFEGLSLLTIVIIAYHHLSRLAVEAALKYFCLNAMASCAFLFSLVFIHNAVGYTNFVSVKNFLNFIIETDGLHPTPGLKIGIVLLLIGFLFKFAVFPFGMWAVDVYSGVSYQTIYFLTVIMKVVVFVIFCRTFVYVLATMSYVWAPYLFFSGIGSIIFGAFGAFSQRAVKRFLAFTAMNNFGFILILISLLQFNTFQYALLFLSSYVIGTTLLIFIINFCKPVNTFRKFYSFSDLSTVATLYPLIGWILTIALVSLAGLPPLAGFFVKYYFFIALIEANYFYLALFLLFINAITIYYYLTIIKCLWFEPVNLQTAPAVFFYSGPVIAHFIFIWYVGFLIGFAFMLGDLFEFSEQWVIVGMIAVFTHAFPVDKIIGWHGTIIV